MSHLEALKERLKRKPEVRPNEGVRVILAPPIQEEKRIAVLEKIKPIITAEKDEGKRAQDILEKIKQKKLSAVIRKIPEEEKARLPPKAPVIQKEKKKKPKKLEEDVIVLEEEGEKVPEELPEGGPRLEEMIPEKVVEEKVEEPGVPPIEEIEVKTKPRKRTTKKVTRGVIELGPELMIEIGDTPLERRLPPVPIFDVKVSSYYMNNREIFVNFINGLFEPYKEDLLDESKGISCEDIGKDTGELSLLTHQKIVRDYINLYTPYRGLLLYHGLGSGKTCSSIAIAEGMKSARKVIIMTPASLRRNYIEEIKKCGDLLYRKNQYWEWISIDDHPDYVDTLSGALGLPREYIRRNHGAWLVNITKESNYKELSASDKKILNDQLDEMISNKYTFINYNGLRRERFKQLTQNFEDNIFDNAVVIIDEAHNLISRIVNKINKIAKFSEKKRGPGALLPQSLALILYEFLLNADNCRVVLLTGTPIINYPNEIGILFNILRGYIKTWNFTLSTETNKKVSKETLQEIFSREKVLDYTDYIPSSKTLTVTRNPYGFENKITASSGYKGVTNEKKEKRNEKGEIERDSKGHIIYDERGQISDTDFVQRIVKILKKNDIIASANGTSYSVNTALPDTLDEFINVFINRDTGNISNVDKFKRRIIGLTSYFRSAQEELLPSYDRNFDRHEVYIPMSDYQFKIYEDYRFDERKSEKPKSGTIDVDGIFKEPSSTYRIFSRLACNFVMPVPPGRPNPAEYREIAEAKKEQKLMAWMKEKYFKDKDAIDSDFKEKWDEFMAAIPEENLNDRFNYGIIKHLLDQYLREYFQKDYRESIQIFFTRMGHGKLFDKPSKKPEDEVALVVKEAKPKAKTAKELEKEEKERAKIAEKTAKEKEREEARAAKKKEKEEAEIFEKAAKEKAREEAREARQKEKEDARLAREILRAEKKTGKKLDVKIAIIIPFRDLEEGKPRTTQLNKLVEYMKRYLRGYTYKIFVIEQENDGRKFNRGQLLNIGFDIAQDEGYNNFIFHDVDLLPSDELKQFYTTIPKEQPVHIAAVWDRYNSNPKYFGGIVSFNKEMFERINGYPNNFWGWGGEDDELYNRTIKFYSIFKPREGSIRDLENLGLQEKLDYLKENKLKFMRKREALAEHEETWQTNGLKQIGVDIYKRDSCGLHCEIILVNVQGTDFVAGSLDNYNDNEGDVGENDFEGGARTKQKAEEPPNPPKDNPAEEFVDEHADDDVISIHLEDYKDEDAILREADELEGDEILESMGNIEYREAIKAAMRYLQLHSREFLSPEGLQTYSPKFLAMLDNIDDPEHQGLHLVYSQFRSMEGIGIFCLVLEANGFAKFKIKRTGTDGWEINMSEEDMGKPCYALYTGTEDAEEREIIRNIYNGMWDYIPNNIATQLRAKSSNNNLGEIIKVLMITSAGSEGINLKNTRYVHIMEPYWHPVRVEQVIGRARRICSHQSLPKELQTVEVFIYIMTFTQQQLDSDYAIELKLKDVSKRPPYLPQTSDQKLFEISTIKEQLTSQLLKAVKESAIDCATHIKSSTKEGLVCLSFGQPTVNDWSYNPNYTQDENDTVAALNVERIDWEARPFTFKATGKRYMLRMDTKQVYDYDSVIQAKQIPGVRPILIGKLVKNSRGEYEIVKEKV
jgi:flagellar biosynthesis GTPase FlhF